MSSYIMFMFEYLFQADELASKLSSEPSGGVGGATGKRHRLPAARTSNNSRAANPCEWLWELLVRDNRSTSSLRSFGEFELFARQHERNSSLVGASAASDIQQALRAESSQSELAALDQAQELSGTSSAAATAATSASNLDNQTLADCFQQMQLEDYYAHYDIYVGLRIASTLTILFIVFILFVIYKTGCRKERPGERRSRSQLALSASCSTNSPAAHYARNYR